MRVWIPRWAVLRDRAWISLWVWNVLWAVVRAPGAGGSWHFFATGSGLLFGDDAGQGLHLYASHPALQIGPIAFLVALPLHLLGTIPGRVAAVVVMSATGPLLLGAIWRLVPAEHRDPDRLLIGGLVFLPVWAELATHAGHLDDILALACGLGAMHARAADRPVLTGLLVAAAADSKPWGLGFAALLLMRPARAALVAAAVCLAGVAVAWLPFLLYDPHTMQAARFTIDNAHSSALRVLGYTGPRTPGWDRPAQIALGVVLGTAAVVRRRWAAVLLLATTARILLDPSVYGYYTAGVVLGALAFDLIATTRRLPLVTVAAAVLLYVSRYLSTSHVLPLTYPDLGRLRVAFALVALAAVFAAVPAVLRPGRAYAGD